MHKAVKECKTEIECLLQVSIETAQENKTIQENKTEDDATSNFLRMLGGQSDSSTVQLIL